MDIQSDRATVIHEQAPMVVPAAPATGYAVAAAPESTTVVTRRTTWFTPSAVIATIAAIVLLVLGGITLARAGLDGPLDEPVVSVAGFTATALLGLIELAIGVCLLSAALSRSREGVMFIGIIAGVLALIAVFEPNVGNGALAIERGFAVMLTIVMAAVVVSALLPSVRRSNVEQHIV